MFVALFNVSLVQSFVSRINTLVNQDLFIVDISSNHGSKAKHGILVNGFLRWSSGVISRQDGFLKEQNSLQSSAYKPQKDNFDDIVINIFANLKFF